MRNLSEWQGEREYVIANVIVVDPKKGSVNEGYVGVRDGRIAFVDAGEPQISSQPVFDGGGFHLSPGFVDIHVHLREPGYEYKETIRSGTMAAIAGGFTSVACMPNTDPAIDEKSVVEFILRKAKMAGFAKVYPIAAATKGRKGERLSEYHDLVEAGAVAVSDDGSPVPTAQVARRVMEYSSNFGIPFIEHCEDLTATADGVMHEGYYSTKLGLRGIPAYSEEICLARDLLILRTVPTKYHAAHLSTKGSVELVSEAKKRGLPVTSETAPHYLCLEDKDLTGFNTCLRINPPIRGADDREALIEALKDGTIDCIASDHAPHAAQEKQVEFDEAPPGAIGLETTFSIVMTYLVRPGHMSLSDALSLITHRPARVLGIAAGTLDVGEPADMTLFDPEEEWLVEEDSFHSKSKNSPYIGMKLTGKVKHTLLDGNLATASLEKSGIGG
ncbi:MAG: dihydroorotase [Candidatus Latescibacterota bacterium]|nr:MAG: dihydroorotase [Candidatus Latescibacterota bacterium]